MPKHTLEDGNKTSYTFVFDSLDDRDVAREVLNTRGIRFRTGKTLVPFRISGNIEWGVKVPERDGLKDLYLLGMAGIFMGTGFLTRPI